MRSNNDTSGPQNTLNTLTDRSKGYPNDKN